MPRYSVHAVNGFSDHRSISEVFVDYFAHVCKCNSNEQNDILVDNFQTCFSQYESFVRDAQVDHCKLANFIQSLHKGKVPGIDGIMTESLLYC